MCQRCWPVKNSNRPHSSDFLYAFQQRQYELNTSTITNKSSWNMICSTWFLSDVEIQISRWHPLKQHSCGGQHSTHILSLLLIEHFGCKLYTNIDTQKVYQSDDYKRIIIVNSTKFNKVITIMTVMNLRKANFLCCFPSSTRRSATEQQL